MTGTTPDVLKNEYREEGKEDGGASGDNKKQQGRSQSAVIDKTNKKKLLENDQSGNQQNSRLEKMQEITSGDDAPDEIMSDLTSRMSAVQMVPPSVRFGRRGGGAGRLGKK